MSHAVGWSKSRSAVSLLNSSEKRDGNRHTESQFGKRFDLGGNADSRGEDVYGMMYGIAVVALPTATVFSHLIQAAQRHDFIELVTRP